MNRPRQNNTIVVGIFSVLVLVIVAGLLLWQSMLLIRVSGYPLVGKFDNVGGLLNQSEVRFRGFRVGRVSDIIPKQDAIYVNFMVSKDVQIPKDSSLRVVFDGLVGEKYIDIVPNPSSEGYMVSGAVLEGYSTAGIADFVDVGTRNLDEVQEILVAFRRITTNPDILKSIENSIFAIEKITENTNEVLFQVRSFSEDQNLKNIVADLSVISGRLAAVIDDEFEEDVNITVKNLREVSDSLRDVLAREGFKSDVRDAVVEGKKMFGTVDSVFGTMSNISFESNASYYRSQVNEANWMTGNVDIWYHSSFLRVGVGNRLGVDPLLNVQQSVRLYKSLRARFGAFYSHPGVGVDYSIYQLAFQTDFYQFDTLQFDAYMSYPIFNHVYLSVGGNDLLDKAFKRSFLFGFKLATD